MKPKVISAYLCVIFCLSASAAQACDHVVTVNASSNQTVCVGDTASFSATAYCDHTPAPDYCSVPPYVWQYEWSAPDGDPSSGSGSSFSCSYDSPGTYAITVTATCENGFEGSDSVAVTVEACCCYECQSGDFWPNMACINGQWECLYGMCLDDECVDVDVFMGSFPDPHEQVVDCDVTFTAQTILSGYESHISWSGGGTPATGSGASFTTRWSTPGTKTVTARIDSCDGNSTWDSDSIGILAYTANHTYEWLRDHCGNPIQNPNNPPSTNGCSAPIIGNCPSLVGCDYCFTEACDGHDYCYSTCNPNSGHKDQCDFNLASDTQTVCASIDGAVCKADCLFWSGQFYIAVVNFGMSNFEDAQEEVCACKDCIE